MAEWFIAPVCFQQRPRLALKRGREIEAGPKGLCLGRVGLPLLGMVK